MKTFIDAASAVQKYLDDETDTIDEEAEIFPANALPVNVGWIFHYNFKKFMETRHPRDGAIGNAPIIYDRTDGTLHDTGTAEPIDHYIEKFLKEKGCKV